MKKYNVYSLFLQLLGLFSYYMGVHTISNLLSNLIYLVFRMPEDLVYLPDFNSILLLDFTQIMLYGLTGWILTSRPQQILGLLKLQETETSATETTTVATSLDQLLEIALYVVGLILILYTLPNFVVESLQFFRDENIGIPESGAGPKILFVHGLRIVLGIVVIAYQGPIVSYLVSRTRL